jgi:hypothetical protein
MDRPPLRDRATALARVLSVVLHPFAVFAALALLAAWRLDRAAFGRTAIGMAVVIAVMAVFIAQRRRSGRWTTVDASHKRDRPLLYALMLALLVGYGWWMGGAASPAVAGLIAVGAMVFTAAVLNRWIKLSLHMASLAFAGVAALSLVRVIGIAALLLLPLLAWSRLKMRRHTPAEVIGGAILGLAFGCMLQYAS